jgi:rhomboid protease GluP
MPTCVSCGRELAPGGHPDNICPECRARAFIRAQEQAKANRPSLIKAMPVTSAIVAVNALVFIAMTLSGASPMMPHNSDLVRWGANTGRQTLLFQPWRIWVSNYIHIGIIHIAANMWCLWNLGALAERVFDRWTHFVTYTFCGIAGSLTSVALHPSGVSAGASGAIFGLAGALISALYLGNLPVHPRALKATLKSLISFAALNIFLGAALPFIDNSAHIGGLVCGLILGAVLARHLTSPPEERSTWRQWVFTVSGVLLLGIFFLIRRSVLHA